MNEKEEPGFETWRKIETYKSLMDYGRGMLRFVFLVNSGSIIAILTYLGNLASKDKPVPNMTCSIEWFIWGIVFAGCAAATAYMTQFKLLNELDRHSTAKGMRHHMTWANFTFLFIVASVVAFCFGSFDAVNALQ